MATVQIRNLDEGAYETLKKRAAASGRSLQEYLRRLLEDQARRPTLAEQFEQIRVDMGWEDGEEGPTMAEIVDIVRAGREGR